MTGDVAATGGSDQAPLYTRIGGDQAVRAALDAFYDKVLADESLRSFFDGVDVDRLKDRQASFMAMALGGPNHYDGRDLRTAHRLPRARGLDEERFERFLVHFRATLEELGLDPDTTDEVMAITYSGKDEVLDR